MFPDGGSTPPASTKIKSNKLNELMFLADRILANVPKIVPIRSAIFI